MAGHHMKKLYSFCIVATGKKLEKYGEADSIALPRFSGYHPIYVTARAVTDLYEIQEEFEATDKNANLTAEQAKKLRETMWALQRTLEAKTMGVFNPLQRQSIFHAQGGSLRCMRSWLGWHCCVRSSVQ